MDNIVKIFASIVDYPQQTLPLDVWEKKDEKYVLRPDVKKEIIDRIESFFERKGFRNIENFWLGTVIGSSIGSLFYGTSTDVDVKAIIDVPEFVKHNDYDLGEELWNLVKDARKDEITAESNPLKSTNNRPLDMYFYSIDYFAPDGIENKSEHSLKKYDSLYYIEKDEWIKYPVTILDIEKYMDKRDVILEKAYTRAEQIAESLDADIGKAKRVSSDIIDFQNFVDTLTSGQKEKLKTKIQKKIDELELVLKDMIDIKKKVINERYLGMEDLDFQLDYENFINSLNYHPDNLKMKILQKYGYIALVAKIQDIVEDKDKDIIEVKEEDVPEIKEVVASQSITAYHGSRYNFDKFESKKGQALFFSTDKEFAKLHAHPIMYVVELMLNNIFDYKKIELMTPDGENLFADIPKIFNLKEGDEHGQRELFNYITNGYWDIFTNKNFISWLKEHGYDSYIERGEGAENIGVFYPEAIKIIDKYVVKDAVGSEAPEFSNLPVKSASKIKIHRYASHFFRIEDFLQGDELKEYNSRHTIDKLKPIPAIWYENDKGEKYFLSEEELNNAYFPPDYPIQVSRFPGVTESYIDTRNNSNIKFENTINCVQPIVEHLCNKGWSMVDAISISSMLCERCLNIAIEQSGGEKYDEEQKKSSHTHCDLCEIIDPEYDKWFKEVWTKELEKNKDKLRAVEQPPIRNLVDGWGNRGMGKNFWYIYFYQEMPTEGDLSTFIIEIANGKDKKAVLTTQDTQHANDFFKSIPEGDYSKLAEVYNNCENPIFVTAYAKFDLRRFIKAAYDYLNKKQSKKISVRRI